MYPLKVFFKISLILFSTSFLSASWQELTYIEPNKLVTHKTRFINLAVKAFEEKEEIVQEKLSKVTSKELSNAWIESGGNDCLVLFTLVQAQNSERLKSLLNQTRFKKEDLEKALLYVRKEEILDCFKDIKSLG